MSLTTGTRLVHDGQLFTVVALEAERIRLRDTTGRMVLLHTGTLVSHPSTRVVGVDDERAAAALGPLLDNLDEPAAAEMRNRLAHIREMLTGLRSGEANLAEPGEPRPAYHPSLPIQKRLEAKATELGVTTRTLRRWMAGFATVARPV